VLSGIVLAFIAALAFVTGGCGHQNIPVTGGDPNAGKVAIGHYGCGSCHTIPGVVGARGEVGPDLAGLRLRMYIAGELPNNPDNLIRWIRNPLAVRQTVDMPNLGVTDSDARNIAAFLYSRE
jgi:cytochrome c